MGGDWGGDDGVRKRGFVPANKLGRHSERVASGSSEMWDCAGADFAADGLTAHSPAAGQR